jgi:branched-chain amino acid transport system substrate-binding protein
MKKTFWILLVILLFCQISGPLRAEESKKIVRIGFNYPITGPYSIHGRYQYLAAQMAQEEINAKGGILGHEIELVIRDSASNVLKTQANVKELIENEKVKMIFGGVSSSVAIAAAELSQKYLMPFFGTLTYSTATTGEEARRVSFRECYNSWMGAKVMADYLQKQFKGKTFHFITADYTYGWTTEESLRKLTGTDDNSLHHGVLTPLGQKNFADELREVATRKPDVLVLILGGKDLMNCLRQATVMGIKTHSQIVVPNLTLGMAVGAGPKAMEGVLGTLPWTWRVPYKYQYERGIRFVADYAARYESYPSTSAASAYTILYEYKAAVERAKSFTTASVVKALEGHSYQLLKDRQTWRDFDHQSVQTVYMVKGKPENEVLKSPYQQDFFEIIHSLSGKDAARTFEEWKDVRIKAGKPVQLEKFHKE